MFYKTPLTAIFTWILVLKTVAQDTLLFEHLPVLNGKVNYHGSIHAGNYSHEQLRNRVTRWYHDEYKKKMNDSDTLLNMDSSIVIRGHFYAKWKMPVFSKYEDVENNTKVKVSHQVNLRLVNNECFYEIDNFRLYVYKPKNILRPFSEFLNIPIENLTDKTSKQKAEKFCDEVDNKIKKLIASLEHFLK
jgi:hypothetical protein